ncbi:hypothetical protein D3C85_1267920 [compost metagenome]
MIASAVCMSMQKAQPLICEARSLTSSIRFFSSGSFDTAVSRAIIALRASGLAV